MLNNLAGWHFAIILGVLGIQALVILGVVFVAIRLSRRKSRNSQ